MKKIFFLLFVLLSMTTSKSQCKLDTAVIIRFAPSVSIRVNKAAKKVELTKIEQMKIAALYQNEDSLLLLTEMQDNDEESRLLIKNDTQQNIKNLLGTERFRQMEEPTASAVIPTDVNSTCEERNKYLESQFTLIGLHKPMSSELNTKLSNHFDSLCLLQKSIPLHDLFLESLHTYSTDTAHFAALFEEEINENTYITAYLSAYTTQVQYSLHPDTFAEILKVSHQRNKAASAILYTYQSQAKWEELAIPLIKQYDKQIQSILERNGINETRNLFFKLVYYKRNLLLTETQVDSLMAKGYSISHDPNFIENDTLVFQTWRQFFSNILNEEQFNEVMKITVISKAKQMADVYFDEIMRDQKVSEIRQAPLLEQLFKYSLSVCLTKERFKEDAVDLKRRLAILEETSPYVFQKQYNIPVKNKRNTGTYMW